MSNANEHAIANAKGWLESIVEMVGAYHAAERENDPSAVEDALQRIQESPLSVQVRTGWHDIGKGTDAEPEEYEILLSTGGPALRITGRLTAYGDAFSGALQWQDWGTPWTDYATFSKAEDDALRDFANMCGPFAY